MMLVKFIARLEFNYSPGAGDVTTKGWGARTPTSTLPWGDTHKFSLRLSLSLTLTLSHSLSHSSRTVESFENRIKYPQPKEVAKLLYEVCLRLCLFAFLLETLSSTVLMSGSELILYIGQKC